jgi:hypothetical protein
MSLVRARSIATVIVGCSSIVPNDNMLFVGDKESLPFTILPFTIGVDGTLWSSLVDAMDAGGNLGRLAPGLFLKIKIKNNGFKSENWGTW